MTSNLKKTIMRRVYYAYTFSIVTSSPLWQGVVFGACIAFFGRLTHVAAISHNFSSVPLKSAPDFVFNAFANALEGGEVLTVLVSVFMIGLSVSFVRKVLPVFGSMGKLRTV